MTNRHETRYFNWQGPDGLYRLTATRPGAGEGAAHVVPVAIIGPDQAELPAGALTAAELNDWARGYIGSGRGYQVRMGGSAHQPAESAPC